MNKSIVFALLFSIAFNSSLTTIYAENPDGVLPGEQTADQILNGEYAFPPSPKISGEVKDDATGFAKELLSKIPPPGVHPRILLSPEDLPDLRRRIKETDTGKALFATLRTRADDALRNPKNWGTELYNKLSSGDQAGATALIVENKSFPPGIGHYQPYLAAIVMEAFDAMVSEDAAKGKKAGIALSTYAKIVQPGSEKVLSGPLGDDVWRAKGTLPIPTEWSLDQNARDAVGYQMMGYGYDFAYNFMSDEDRAAVRKLISTVTFGKLWMGASLPHHFRNWNWCAVALGQPLLALAIEGEDGYDPRVYKLGVECARDYLTYGISPSGASTEAVGYTQFGLVWANPFLVAAARRGDNLLIQGHHRAMIDWYLQSMQPFGGAWVSHGDGGDGPPTIWTALMWKRFFPTDPKIDYLWQSVLKAGGDDALKGNFHIIEPLIHATDPLKDAQGKPVDYAAGAKLNLPVTWFDPVRSSLIARTDWTPDALALQFECRTDSVGASHEHADRGNFTLSALGRSWAKDNFRSVETRHHNGILIDGKGQGFWPGPGQWLGLEEKGHFLIAACDAKPAYDWMWPKQIISEQDNFVRFNYARWDSFRANAATFRQEYGDLPAERDNRPSVVAHWTGFGKGDPRMWDEDSWPVRYPHNPVRRAFRSLVFSKGVNPYVIVVDDIQKDDQERLYEWLMQTGSDTEIASFSGNDIILCDATVKRDAQGLVQPAKGDRQLLVRILSLGNPAKPRDYQTRPSARLETFERKDTLAPEMNKGFLSGSRSFGLDKRLVIASRSVAPGFRIFLYPHRKGDALPVTTWNDDQSILTIEGPQQKEILNFLQNADGRTRFQVDDPK